MQSFKFSDPRAQRMLIGYLQKHLIPFKATNSGSIVFASMALPQLEKAISNVRWKLFDFWQVLSFPPDWESRYRQYMTKHKISFFEEEYNGVKRFLLHQKFRPHQWKL